MRAIGEFLKTTVVGGLLVLLPAYLAVLLVLKGVAAVGQLLGPITAGLSGEYRTVVAFLIVVAACFATGVAVRTRIGRRVKQAVESRLLERLPGYTLIRAVSRRLGGQDDPATFAVALIEIEDALTPGFVVEEHDDGRCTVFVPSVPTPAAGAIYILSADRVHRIDVPLATALGCITRWGTGTGALLAAMPQQRPAIAR